MEVIKLSSGHPRLARSLTPQAIIGVRESRLPLRRQSGAAFRSDYSLGGFRTPSAPAPAGRRIFAKFGRRFEMPQPSRSRRATQALAETFDALATTARASDCLFQDRNHAG